MKYAKQLFIIGLLSISVSAVHADSSIGFSLGLNFNLNSLGGTIMKDGLNSGLGKPAMTGANVGTGCSTAVSPTDCLQESPGSLQKIIPAENELKVLHEIYGRLITADTNGAMTGGILSIFYESSIGEVGFYRIGIDRNVKIAGGHTKSYALGMKWLDVVWDYKAWYVPFLVGLKLKMADNKAAAYIAIGGFYYSGGWSVGGYNNGDLLNTALGPYSPRAGAQTVISNGKVKGGPLANETLHFRAKGVGLNVLLGAEGKVGSGKNKIFIEIDYKLGGNQSKPARSLSGGLASGIAPWIAYPVVMGGTSYRFGYKMAL